MVGEVKREEGKADKVPEGSAASLPPVPDCSCEAKPSSLRRRTSGPTRMSTKAGWTKEEDDLLARAVRHYEAKHWKKIAELLPGWTDVQCLHRWQKVLNPELIKGTWTKEEDDLIIELVKKHGSKRWSEIAKSLPGRIGKQCRERDGLVQLSQAETMVAQPLKPCNKKGCMDNRGRGDFNLCSSDIWKQMGRHFQVLPGRADNSIKNHWNCSLKKRLDTFFTFEILGQQPGNGTAALDLNNHVVRIGGSKLDFSEQTNGNLASPDLKLNGDRHVVSSSVGSGHHDTGPERQNLSLEPFLLGNFKCLGAENQNISIDDSKRLKVEVKHIQVSESPFCREGMSPVGNVSTDLCTKDANCWHKDNSDCTCSSGSSSSGSAFRLKAYRSSGHQICVQIHSDESLCKVPLQSLQKPKQHALNLHIRDMSEKFKENCILSLPTCDLSDHDRVEGFNQVPSTPLPSDNKNLGSLYYVPLHLSGLGGSISSEKMSNSVGHIQQSSCSFYCATLPNLSLSPACIPTSPESILRNAARSFKRTPSIFRKRGRESSKQLFVENPPRATAGVKDSPGTKDP